MTGKSMYASRVEAPGFSPATQMHLDVGLQPPWRAQGLKPITFFVSFRRAEARRFHQRAWKYMVRRSLN